MAKNRFKNRIFRYNRRIRGLTNYRKRLAYLKSGKTRLVVRRSNRAVLVQFVDYDPKGDNVITSASSLNLSKLGSTLSSGNVTSAYLTGYLAGKKFLKKNKNNDECIVDLGLQNIYFKGKLFAAIKGVIDAGVKVKVSEDLEFPDENRIKGEHLKTKDAVKVYEKVKSKIDKL